MNNNRKMKISDLRPSAPDGVDWLALDQFFYNDSKTILAQALILTNIIKTTNLMSRPEIDTSIVMGYLTGMANDTTTLSNELALITAEYEKNKKQYQGNYNEDAHMFSLTMGYAMSDWIGRYDETVAQNINELVDYINSLVPAQYALISTPPQQH